MANVKWMRESTWFNLFFFCVLKLLLHILMNSWYTDIPIWWFYLFKLKKTLASHFASLQQQDRPAQCTNEASFDKFRLKCKFLKGKKLLLVVFLNVFLFVFFSLLKMELNICIFILLSIQTLSVGNVFDFSQFLMHSRVFNRDFVFESMNVTFKMQNWKKMLIKNHWILFSFGSRSHFYLFNT